MIQANKSTVILGSVGRFIRGITFKPEDVVSHTVANAVVCMRTKNVQKDLDASDMIAVPPSFVRRKEQYLEEGDILLSSANSWNLVGKCCWVPQLDYAATAGGFISIFRADRKHVFPRYLYYWMSSCDVQEALRKCGRQTTNISNLDLRRAEKLTIPLPPLPEQKRIAAILDQADAIRRKRQQAVQNTGELIAAIFDDRFGDHPERNGHFVADLGDHADIASGVTKGRRFGEQATVMLPYLRVANVQDGKLDLSEIKTVEALPSDLEKYRLQPGDVLLTEGGDHDKLGRGTLWEGQVKDCIHQNHIFRVRVDRTKLLPIFLASYIQTTFAKAYFLRCAKKTSNLATINMRQLRALPVPLPPIDEQYDFHAEVEAVRCLNQRSVSAFKQSDNLFASLVHRAFRREL